MLIPYATGFILGSGITLVLYYLYFKYKIYEPYKRTSTEVINLKDGIMEEQQKVIRKQEVLIEEMKKYIANKEEVKNSLGKN